MWVCLASVHFAHKQGKTKRIHTAVSPTSHVHMCCKYFIAVQGSLLTLQVSLSRDLLARCEASSRLLSDLDQLAQNLPPEQKHRQRTYNIKQSFGCYSAGAEEHAQEWNQAKLKSIAVHLYSQRQPLSADSTEAFINLYWTMTHTYCP